MIQCADCAKRAAESRRAERLEVVSRILAGEVACLGIPTSGEYRLYSVRALEIADALIAEVDKCPK